MPGVPDETRSTEVAAGPGGAVEAAEAVAGVGVAEPSWALELRIPTAVTRDAARRGPIETGGAAITVRPGVASEALVTHHRVSSISVAAGGGGGVGAGAGATGVCVGSGEAAVEAGSTLLTVGSLSVAFTV